MATILISHKDIADYELTLQLWHKRISTIPGDLFKQSNLTEIRFLLANNVLQLMQYNSNKHGGVNLFKFRLIYEIKGKVIDKSYKKSCFVIQGYNDIEKTVFLFQVLTIQ